MTAPIADTRQAGGPSAADRAQEYGDYRGGTSPADWVRFAGFMLALAGCMNVVHGIAAIRDSRVFPSHPEVVISNLHAWGWTVAILGGLQLAAAFGIWAGNQLARWFGVAVLLANALAQLVFASAFPIWSLTIFGLDLLAIYALVVHGRSWARE
jgi:hypothetical protein